MTKTQTSETLETSMLIFHRIDLYVVLGMTFLVFFGQNLLGIQYTGWDTHDLGFTSFLYFNDALQSGQIPLWNPFIQGGTFHASLFNVGNYTPFQWIFFFLSQYISPLYAYELMIQSVTLIGLAGFYFWLKSRSDNVPISIFGAHAFFLSVLMPLVGQIMFLFSLSALPWMLLVCEKAMRHEEKKNQWALHLTWGILIASFMASGYPWMNVMNFAIAVSYVFSLYITNGFKRCNDVRVVAGNLLIFFTGAVVVLVCYYGPGYYALKFYYHIFNGDYASHEPRLRSLSPNKWGFSYRNISEAIVSTIDPRILRNNAESISKLPLWSWGVGWVVVLILANQNISLKFLRQNIYWLVVLLFFLLYSSGTLAELVPYLPIFNANRWWVLGQVYVFMSLIVLATNGLIQVKDSDRRTRGLGRLLVCTIVFIVALMFWSAPLDQYVLILAVSVTIYYLFSSNSPIRWRRGLVMLMSLNLLSFVLILDSIPGISRSQHMISGDPSQNYFKEIEQRKAYPDLIENYRRLGHSDIYIYNDLEWLIKKVPFSHGYNPLGNPLYWHLKDEDSLQRLVYATQEVRVGTNISRTEFSTDIDFAEALFQDITSSPHLPTLDGLQDLHLESNPRFAWEITDLILKPNQAKMRLAINDAGYLIFNNTYFPGWEVSINEQNAELALVNRIFQAVYLDGPGEYTVSFNFIPTVIICLLISPPIMFLLAMILVLRENRHLRKGQIH